MIYLDHAATTPVPRPVADAMYQVLTEQFGNPSSQYPLGREAKALVEEGRAVVAGALGCRPENLHFTSCGTESDNWAISAAVWQGRHTGRHIITTAVEHSAVLEPCKLLQQQGYEVTYLAPDKTGHVTAEQVAQALREDTVLVSMMLVNNETGCIFPVREVARLLREKNSRALLHCDAVQGFLKVPFAAKTLGADLISVSSHKIHGPKGCGTLYISPRLKSFPALLQGGGQEGGYRSGTEATPAIFGFAAACTALSATFNADASREKALLSHAVSQLSKLDGLVVNGAHDAPHILSPAYLPRTPSIFCKTTASAFPPVPPVPRGTAAMCWKPWGCLRRSWTAPSGSPCAGTPPPRSWTLSFRSSGRRSFPGQDDAFQSSDSACADRRFCGKCNHATKKLQTPLVFSARFCYNSGILWNL